MPPLGESEPDTLHDDLSAAFDSAAADASVAPADTPSKTTQSAELGTAEVANGASAVASSDTGERARGPDGKFVASAEPAKGVSADKGAADRTTSAAPKPIPSTDTTKASTDAPSTAPDAPPVGWTAEGKAEWPSLSPAVKAAVLKREVEISSGGRQWSEEKRHYEAIVAPVRAAASRRGISEAEGIQRLMTAQDRLDRDPAGAIQWLAQAYGVPVTVNGNANPINGQPAADGSSRIEPPAFRDPRIDDIQARLDAQDRRETEMTVQRVTAFATDTTHPHFDAVSAEIMAMLPLLQSRNPRATPEELLQTAYDSAVYANPETRRAVQAQLAADADAQRRSTNSAEVAKARLASSSIRPGAPAGVPAAGPKDSIREELLAAWQ